MGITKMLVSAKLNEENVIFLHYLQSRLNNRVSLSSIINELIGACRILYHRQQLTFTGESSQLLLNIPCKPNDKQGVFEFD